MVMDEPDAAAAFDAGSAVVQAPVYEVNAATASKLVPRGGHVLDLGSGSGRLAARLLAGRPDLTATCVDLSEPMLELGRELADREGLRGRMSFLRADITDLPSLPKKPDLVTCVWTLHQLPDQEVTRRALAQIGRLREQHRCGVWIFDFARLRRPDTFGRILDLYFPDISPRLRLDGVASEAAAWTPEEMAGLIADAGVDGLVRASDRILGFYQAWWTRPTVTAPAYVPPPASDAALSLSRRIRAGLRPLP
jgi:SAM-dependent methyltransferase